jgi:acyl-CoA thioester hydrolase
MIENFKHKSSTYIRFSDIDAFGHVNNAVYLTFFEQARFNYFNDVVKVDVQWAKQGIILAKAEVDFILPVIITDKISIYTRCSRIGNKSFDLEYVAVREKNGLEEIVAKSLSILVAFDYQKKLPMNILDSWRQQFHKYETSLKIS